MRGLRQSIASSRQAICEAVIATTPSVAAWPYEPPPIQSLRIERHAHAVMPEHLDQIAATPSEDVQIAGMRVALEPLLHQQRQTEHPTAHVCAAGREPDPDVASDRDHRLSDRTTAATNAGGASLAIRSTAPPTSSTIAHPAAGSGSAPTVTAAKPGDTGSARSRRHR